ncbi:acyl-CoA hydrolase [Flammeovirgaceae bacterium 311]|nr:acyl-CoA hydrolase [Flammeovirgaceae bacterium 311]
MAGRIQKSAIGKTRLKVQVDIFNEKLHPFHREKALSCTSTFVAIDKNKTPLKAF